MIFAFCMIQEAGYAKPGRGVVLADLQSDGYSEVLYAGINVYGYVTLSVVDHRGNPIWEHPFVVNSPSWPDSGVNLWAVGRFNTDNVLDAVVQWHDIGHSVSKLTALNGIDGSPLWEVVEVTIPGMVRSTFWYLT